MTAGACFHCALPVDQDDEFQVEINGELKPVCCPGCKAVAELIRDSGMSGYYELRETPQPGVGRPAEDVNQWQVFDRTDMLEAFASLDERYAEATVYVGNMYCAACGWLIESTLARQKGVESAEVNPVTHRLRIRWRLGDTRFSSILGALAGLGYGPQPLAPASTARPELAEQRSALKRLLVASLGMMQAMMFAIGLYAGEFQGIDADMQLFLRLVSFIVTTPVVFYSARPFFAAAWRGLRRRSYGMDLPVSIAVGTAYAASIYAMLTGGEAVWFDSVTMFVFFLTLGRFLEMRARHRSIDRNTALLSVLPNTVTRVDRSGDIVVPVGQLVAGDKIRVLAGESIPADGVLTDGVTSVDESLLTGEARPLPRKPGDRLVAGSVNIDGRIELMVEKTGPDTTLGTISRLSERARFLRPAFVQLADRVASYIVVAILASAAIVAGYWFLHSPERAFVITLSVLVVTCPCALALATPAAFAAASTRMAELRLLVTNGNAIEALSSATRVVFDKTGTLTRGRPAITSIAVLDPAYSERQCRDIAAALESASTHPIAAAFASAGPGLSADDQRIIIGEGVSGTVEGRRWRLGRAAFAGRADSRVEELQHVAATSVFLGVEGKVVAVFGLEDALRPGAADTLLRLGQMGLEITLASGDHERVVQSVAEQLGVRDYRSGCSPGDKLAVLKSLQARGETVVMVGDGINDAPVLAGADASLALADGALLAQTSADVIMLGESLSPLVTALETSRQTMRIVRQNIGWAIVYNATALPAAALGLVPPWAAAIGMSASSLVVVLNALRLSRFGAS
jgi:Cu2+-exporting ATPase